MKGYTDIDLPEDTVHKGVSMGLMVWNDAEKVYELTPKGRKWLLDYCDEEIKVARSQAL